MKRTLFTSVCLLIFAGICSTAIAQIEVAGTEAMLDRLRLKKLKEATSSNYYEEVKGEGYLCPQFADGYLRTIDGNIYKGKFRYDMYSGIPEFLVDKYIYQLSAPQLVDTIIMGDYKLVYAEMAKGEDEDAGRSTFFIVIEDGSYQLLQRPGVVYRAAELPKPYQPAKPAQFLPIADSYYIKADDKPAVRIRSKKDILAALNDSDKDVAGYIKKNKISQNKQDDLEKVVSYCNSL